MELISLMGFIGTRALIKDLAGLGNWIDSHVVVLPFFVAFFGGGKKAKLVGFWITVA